MYQVSDTVIVMNIPSDYLDEIKDTGSKSYRGEYGSYPLYDYTFFPPVPLVYMHIIKGRDTGNSIISFANVLKYNELKETKTNKKE